MDDEVGLHGRHPLRHRVAIADVEPGPIGSDDLMVGMVGEHGEQVRPELPPGPRDEDLHACAWTAFSGSHHQRLSRYQATVWSRASSRTTSGAQPRARIRDVSTA